MDIERKERHSGRPSSRKILCLKKRETMEVTDGYRKKIALLWNDARGSLFIGDI